MKSIRFDVFGRSVLVVGSGDSWKAYYVGAEGKRRPATDIVIPTGTREAGLVEYLDDLCHEWANERNNRVTRLD